MSFNEGIACFIEG